MKVRIDDFTYDGDCWFSFRIWDSKVYEEDRDGEGAGTYILVRPLKKSQTSETTESPNGWLGAARSINWYTRVEQNVSRLIVGDMGVTPNSGQDQSPNDLYVFADDINKFDEDRNPTFTLQIKWNADLGRCEMFVNDLAAPDEYNAQMSDYFKGSDYMAHIAFSLQNSNVGGKAAFTILEFGTTEDDATPPMGDDSAEPQVFKNVSVGKPGYGLVFISTLVMGPSQ